MSFANISLVALISVAAILRFFRIYELTEFLADQGRTGIIIYQAWVEKSLPLVGPPVLTGQHLGPFFYYLTAPSFILVNFNPLGPALFMALLGVLTVFLVFYIGQKVFGFWIGFFIAALYAASPSLISQTRTLWDPTPIPFFVLLFILSLYKIYQERSFRWFVILGTLLGILIQLHYPNVFFIPLSVLFLAYIIRSEKEKSSSKKMLGWTLAGILAFLATLFPFLLYEVQHTFVDLREIALIMLLGGANNGIALPYYQRIFDITSRLFHTMFPFDQLWVLPIASLIIFIPFFRPRFWHILFASWFIVGVLAISLYKGTLFDHYLNFLLPVPFFLLGAFVQATMRYLPRTIWAGVAIFLITFNLSQVDITSKGKNDILRTKRMTDEIRQQAKSSSFSFTLISSRSFSDLHYRYFFLLQDVKPMKITDNDYDLLFLVCEKSPCPTVSEKESIQALCYDPHCEGEYPKISLTNFSLASSKEVFDGRIFTFRRKNDQKSQHN